MWELDHKEVWALKNWCIWTVVLVKTLESPSNCKEIQPVNPKGNQSWIFIGRTDAETEIPILRPPDAKNWLIRKDPDAGNDWMQEEKGKAEDEMIGWHRRWTWVWANSGSWWWTFAWHAAVPGVSKGWTRLSNWTELNWSSLSSLLDKYKLIYKYKLILDSITNSTDMNMSKLWEIVKDTEAWHPAVHRVAKRQK